MDEPTVEKVVKVAVKRRPDPTAEPVAKNKRTTVGRAAPTEKNLSIIPVLQDAEPISVVPAESPSAQRRQAPKRKLILQAEPDEEETEKEIVVVETEDKDKEEPIEMETAEKKADEEVIDFEDTEPLSKVLNLTETSLSDEESKPIDDILRQIPEDMMLPSILAEEPTRIVFGHGIEIKEVDWYKATLLKIDPMDKGKAPLGGDQGKSG
ncbi:cell synthase 1 [Dorcoceras hygrometricum]|uniref:Cell synthase 1 n=1 Tax=Dorcoceras hygrometricum TaxID=472368 RepID=A0A2Z7A0L5_9LAMI|nr:cell synthase 1 [Dorcoceras hygrometricum]